MNIQCNKVQTIVGDFYDNANRKPSQPCGWEGLFCFQRTPL